jgi:Zn-dependent metalloprotease
MSTTNHGRHTLHCILPPHILENIVRNAGPEAREFALDTLAGDTTVRQTRVTLQMVRMLAEQPQREALAPHRQRMIYNANQGTGLPGNLVRSEGQGATGDAATDEAYDGLGATFDLYWNVYARNSIDNAGMNLVGTVHYGQQYDNAFWNGQQMVFGDGDGALFNRFTVSLDVIGHELTHGVTQDEAALVYMFQPGALNESISDVFGSLIKQHAASQTAAEADWLIGAGLFTDAVNGHALRSMKAPGTAYDDPVLGKDPQPDHMDRYSNTYLDNGGVHINSGIPNKAFYQAAVDLGGFAWEKAGRIWYETLRDSALRENTGFKRFANLTVSTATRLYGPDAIEPAIVANAWAAVGIATTSRVPAVPQKARRART